MVDQEAYPNYLYDICDRNNRGNSAGIKSRCLGLGTPTEPITIDRNNALDIFADLYNVVEEQDVGWPGVDYIVSAHPATLQWYYDTIYTYGYRKIKLMVNGEYVFSISMADVAVHIYDNHNIKIWRTPESMIYSMYCTKNIAFNLIVPESVSIAVVSVGVK